MNRFYILPRHYPYAARKRVVPAEPLVMAFPKGSIRPHHGEAYYRPEVKRGSVMLDLIKELFSRRPQ